MSHLTRPSHRARFPLRVTMRLAEGCLANLRRRQLYRVLYRAFCLGCDRFGFRIVQYSVQRKQLHLICEAADKRALARGMQGFNVRVARRLNRALRRSGQVFAERYRAVELTGPAQVRRALVHVLNLARVREGPSSPRWIDPCSSAAHFDGWKRASVRWVPPPRPGPPPVAPAHTELLRQAWRPLGLLDPSEHPR